MTHPLLIPKPVAYEEKPGLFPLRDGLSIALSHAAERGEWVAARAVQEELRRRGLSAPIQPQRLCPDAAHTIVLAVRGRDEGVFPSVAPASAGPPSPDALGAQDALGAHEAYTLAVDDGSIVLWAAAPEGVARGAQTLRQLLAQAGAGVPAARVEDAPAFPWRGVMLDVSRGKVPTPATLRRIVDLLSFFKVNMLQLYVEHTFASRRHPDIGRGWGALTPEELVALDAYCRERYVELVPCLQSFGHLRHILELPAYTHLAESEALWSLAPALEGTYDLLGDLYADFLACFTSPYLNVCSDETYDLGAGQSRDIVAREGKGGLFLRHMRRLHALAAAHGRTMMVWDDMFLHYPELLAELPRDTILLNWWYAAQEHYPQVETVRRAGLRQIVCPGTSSWRTLFPRLANARANIRNMVADGRRAGALGVLNTDWGDNGHPNLLGCSWYGYAFGAGESWSPGALSDEEFDAAFARLFFGAAAAGPAHAAMDALAEACVLPGLAQGNGSRTISMFFGNPLLVERAGLTADQAEFMVEMLRVHGTDVSAEAIQDESHREEGPVPEATLARLGELAAAALAHLAPLRGESDEASATLDEWRFAARQIAHAAEKARLGREAVERAGDMDGAEREGLARSLGALKRELHELRRAYEGLWLARNKPEGLWLTLDQLDEAAGVLDGWLARVRTDYGWS